VFGRQLEPGFVEAILIASPGKRASCFLRETFLTGGSDGTTIERQHGSAAVLTGGYSQDAGRHELVIDRE